MVRVNRDSKYSEIQKIPTQFGVCLNYVHAQINALLLIHVSKRRIIYLRLFLFIDICFYNYNKTFRRLKNKNYEPKEQNCLPSHSPTITLILLVSYFPFLITIYIIFTNIRSFSLYFFVTSFLN